MVSSQRSGVVGKDATEAKFVNIAEDLFLGNNRLAVVAKSDAKIGMLSLSHSRSVGRIAAKGPKHVGSFFKIIRGGFHRFD
jgi:hypothetical protein